MQPPRRRGAEEAAEKKERVEDRRATETRRHRGTEAAPTCRVASASREAGQGKRKPRSEPHAVTRRSRRRPPCLRASVPLWLPHLLPLLGVRLGASASRRLHFLT